MGRSRHSYGQYQSIAIEEQSDAVAVEIDGSEQSFIHDVIGSDVELSLTDEPSPVKQEAEEPEPKAEPREFDRTAFDRLLEIYKERDKEFSSLCALACKGTAFADRFLTAFSVVLGERFHFLSQTATHVTHNYRPHLPNRVDLIADAELVAKRALKEHPKLWKVFEENILEKEMTIEDWEVSPEIPRETRLAVELVVGHAYLKAGLYPLSRYFRSSMVRK